MLDYIIDNPEVAAAFLSALATAIAAYATIVGPKAAAKLAEKLRQNSENEREQHRLKLWIFTTLMQERAAIWTQEAVRALNSIDVVFKDSMSVRERWSSLYQAFSDEQRYPAHVQSERFRGLLTAMAEDLQLSSGLRMDDFERVYYPNALAEEDSVRRLEHQAALRRLSPQATSTSNTQGLTESPYPPPPQNS